MDEAIINSMRLGILYKIYLLGFLLLAIRLFWMQVIQAEYYQDQSARNRIRLIGLPAPRGTLYDRNGKVIAEDRVRYDLALIPQEVEDREEIFKVISQQLNIPVDSLRQDYHKGYRAPFAPVSLVSNISKEQALSFEEKLFRLPGLLVETRPTRYYHNGRAIAHVVGYLGEIGAEELERLKPYGYKVRDLVGRTGLEKSFDLELRGENGGTQIEVNHRGRMIQILGHRSPKRGKDLRLTVDASLQEKASALLAGRRGAVVALNPGSGEILAMTSYPAFDPNAFLDSKRRREIKEWLQQQDSPFLNRALGAYTPGSIFKVVTASAALQKGKINPQTSFECDGFLRLGNYSFSCWNEEGHGSENLFEGLAHSCNVYFFHLGLLMGPEPIAEECRRWGLGRGTEIELAGEAPGLVPNRRWKWQIFHQPWYDGDTLNFAIGQGYLLMTPLQAARMISVVANGGKLVKPYVVKQVGSSEEPHPRSQSIGVGQKTLDAVTEGLRRTIDDPTGTGQLALSSQVSIAGKTGTAETPDGASHAWFVGFAPVENPKIAFAVFLEHGGGGGYAAAPIGRQLVEHFIKDEKKL